MDADDRNTEMLFGEVPEGRGAMAALDLTGDTKTMWDPNSADEVAEAKAQFDRLRAKGYSAFRVDDKDPNKKGARMAEFDPEAQRMILVPQMQGG
jgi:hypothetical protein